MLFYAARTFCNLLNTTDQIDKTETNWVCCRWQKGHRRGGGAIHPKKRYHRGIGRSIQLPYRALFNTFLLTALPFELIYVVFILDIEYHMLN